MIGSAFKKFAQENGMAVAHGAGYGVLNGYVATLTEGRGYKQIVFSTVFPDPASLGTFQQELNKHNLKKEFRVQDINIGSRTVSVVFLDNPGTMKKIRAFLDWFIPVLRACGATDSGICTECGCTIESGHWAMVNGVAYHFHEACARKVQQQVELGNEERKNSDTGNYFTGLLGALGGAVVGAVAWAALLLLGYIASIVGLLIGWLSEKGYNLLKGKQGKAKVVILIFAIIVGVLLGNIGADAFTLFEMIQEGELPGMTVGEIPAMILLVFLEDPEYRAATIKNVLMGILFAALGVYALLRKTGREVADVKYIDLL